MPGSVPFGRGEVSEQFLHLGALQRSWAQPFRAVPSQKQRQEPVTKTAVRVVNDRPSRNMFFAVHLRSCRHRDSDVAPLLEQREPGAGSRLAKRQADLRAADANPSNLSASEPVR
jgi:hypothetical protein